MTALDYIASVTATVEPARSPDTVTVQRLRGILGLVLEKTDVVEKSGSGYLEKEATYTFRYRDCPLVTVKFEVQHSPWSTEATRMLYIKLGPAAFAHFSIANPVSKDDLFKIKAGLHAIADAASDARNSAHGQDWANAAPAFLTVFIAHLKVTNRSGNRINTILAPSRYALFEAYQLSAEERRWWQAA